MFVFRRAKVRNKAQLLVSQIVKIILSTNNPTSPTMLFTLVTSI